MAIALIHVDTIDGHDQRVSPSNVSNVINRVRKINCATNRGPIKRVSNYTCHVRRIFNKSIVNQVFAQSTDINVVNALLITRVDFVSICEQRL